ncbi:MAG: trypsin-like peptidase domain-containing protein [Oscillospiraceae bacterium]|nr:trypsin-like peptidase domain-containing protein [Oscillospiraceae bacterium]
MYENSDFESLLQRPVEQSSQMIEVSIQKRPEMMAEVRTEPRPVRKRPRRGNAKLVLLFVMCFIFAAGAGFAGGMFAGTLMPGTVALEPAPEEMQYLLREEMPEPESVDTAEDVQVTGAEIMSDEESLDGEEPLSPSVINALLGQQMTTAEVAAAVRDSVVEIQTERVTTGVWGVQRITEGAGSGVIISENGLIITNDHVISGAAAITVRLADGREFDAELLGTDVRTDTAVIRIDAAELTPVSFGDSESLAVGDSAMAVGNPLGQLGGTVTSGIISALDRDIVLDGEIMTLLQTDAAVNPGNSGGGLFNMEAELIGVVVAKSGGVDIEGLGFAIPSNTVMQVALDLLTYGFVRGRADAGLELLDILTNDMARRHGVSQPGLYILASEYEGLLRGDRIVAIDNRALTNKMGFNAALRNRSPDDVIEVAVVRGGQEVTVEVTLREWRP